MSTRSFIAKQIGKDAYLTVYCHSDGYLTHNGALLLDCYNTPEQVDELLKLGDLSYLAESLYPNPDYPHSFDYGERQSGVTVAYGRDRGDKDVAAVRMTMAQLDDPNNWTEYVYIFTQENEWKYFAAGHSQDGLRSVEKDLEAEYGAYGIRRPQGYHGVITDSLVERIKAAENTESMEIAEAAQSDPSGPVLSL